jgi:hypothetical protein
MAFAAFDLLELDGHSLMAEPWTARRKRLEDLLEAPAAGVCLVPVTEDAPALWDTWVGSGGEGIVLNRRTGYRSIPLGITPLQTSSCRSPILTSTREIAGNTDCLSDLDSAPVRGSCSGTRAARPRPSPPSGRAARSRRSPQPRA